ncbi:MAG: ribosome biogenesis GTPase Der [Deltaproteobacteria bacterium]|nr:ribosome biogenesis GTPase Der [Deltaproteobacteria bacterium]
MKSYVVITGRPNVGKSTLFNRIIRSRKALIDDFAGVTRDKIYAEAEWNGKYFTLIDTGGFSEFDEDPFAGIIRDQIFSAIQEADAVLFMFNGKEGLTPADITIAERLRHVSKPTFYVVNKIDDPKHKTMLSDFYKLGVDKLYPISATHGAGVSDVMDALAEILPQEEEPKEPEGIIRLAVLGRPNAGKSSLINRILDSNRLLVSDIPGTTRDAVDTLFNINNKCYQLIDTAGIRRKKATSQKLDKISIIKALKALDRCHIAILMIDASAGIVDQDIAIASYIAERGRGCIIVLNKWDLAPNVSDAVLSYVNLVRERFRFLTFAPVLTTSALTGKRVFKLFDLANEVYEQYNVRIGTSPLNRMFREIFDSQPPPRHKGRVVKCYYATQIRVRPPTFVCFVNTPDGLPASYKRYITNQLREKSGLGKTPIRVIFRKRERKK